MKEVTIQIRNSVSFLSRDEVLKACGDAYDTAVATHNADEEAIAFTLNALYTENPGAKFNARYLEATVGARLNATAKAFPVIVNRLNDYLKAHTGANGVALFGNIKGKGGGTFLWKHYKLPA